MEDSVKYKVISLLDAGQEPRDIADELDVSYSSIVNLKNKLKQAKLNGTLNQLVDTDRLIIERAGEELKLDASHIVKGLDGLETLRDELQKSALAIVQQTKSLTLSVEHPSELQVYATIICDLQNAFFNKNQTQINVQNNIGSASGAPRYTKFLSDKPGS